MSQSETMTHFKTITLYLLYTNDNDIQRTYLDITIIESLIIYLVEILQYINIVPVVLWFVELISRSMVDFPVNLLR